MERQPLLSIIVPVYNVESYIEQCVESLEKQTFKDREIILVDDGSTDGSAILCDEMGRRYKDIVVIHKSNGGSASARNVGIEFAKGSYIGFVDSDDYIEEDMYQSLYDAMQREKCLIAGCNRYRHFEDNGETRIVPVVNDINTYKVMDNGQILKSLLLNKGMTYSACDKLFNREVFATLRFPEGKLPAEDIECIYKVLAVCERFVHIGMPKYYYRLNINSKTQSTFNAQHMMTFVYMEEIYQDVLQHNPMYKHEAVFAVVQATAALYHQLMADGMERECYEEKKQLETFLQRHIIEVFRNGFLSRNAKIGVVAIAIKCYPIFLKLRKNYGKNK